MNEDALSLSKVKVLGIPHISDPSSDYLIQFKNLIVSSIKKEVIFLTALWKKSVGPGISSGAGSEGKEGKEFGFLIAWQT